MSSKIIINTNYIEEYKNIIQTTNLQRAYQEQIKFFRYLRNCLQKEMVDLKFTGNIVENNMDYSYFQITNFNLKQEGLKIVFVFLHQQFKYQIWLSGVNRQEQLKKINMYQKSTNYNLTSNPIKTDYIIRKDVETKFDYNNLEKLINDLKEEIYSFINDISYNIQNSISKNDLR